METIELNAENIAQYLPDCVELQKYLVTDPTTIDSDFFVKTAECSHSYLVGILDDEHVVGLGVISKVVHPVNVTGYLNNIVVHPDTRGKGLFSVIMDTLEAKAKDWHCTDLALTCSREAVQGMYIKRGYAEKETGFYLLKIS
ncbi:MAG: GNAT superfamily N-acetyltransferase [Acidimicrobiales bacterium]|jgi:GNAT superfamily N-acetyltransferase